jgi:hypothetical protein
MLVSAFDGFRRQAWLLLAVVAIALSLLAMHHLSSNHTVAGTTTATTEVAAAQSAARPGQDSHHLADRHPHAHQLDVDPHGPQVGVAGDDYPSNDGDCPGCAGHHAMALTCLAALILLFTGWVLSRPAAWRAVRLRRPTLPPRDAAPFWTPRSLSLIELTVSRT